MSASPSPDRLIGIGASAGGIEPLSVMLAALPGDLPHAVLVVLHLPAHGHSVLAQILARHCRLEVLEARDGETIRPSTVHVAPPDHHLTLSGTAIALTSAPQEHSVRPAIDPLLRSLAVGYGPAAVAVVLSGALSDGAVGVRCIAEAGGRVFVQDPLEALVPSMPLRAIEAAGGAADVLPAAAIGAELARLGSPPEIAAGRVAGSPA